MLHPREEITEKSLTLKMRPLLAGEPKERPPRKWTHHSSTSAAAEAASPRATFAGAGTTISSSDFWRGGEGKEGEGKGTGIRKSPGDPAAVDVIVNDQPAAQRPRGTVSPAHTTILEQVQFGPYTLLAHTLPSPFRLRFSPQHRPHHAAAAPACSTCPDTIPNPLAAPAVQREAPTGERRESSRFQAPPITSSRRRGTPALPSLVPMASWHFPVWFWVWGCCAAASARRVPPICSSPYGISLRSRVCGACRLFVGRRTPGTLGGSGTRLRRRRNCSRQDGEGRLL